MVKKKTCICQKEKADNLRDHMCIELRTMHKKLYVQNLKFSLQMNPCGAPITAARPTPMHRTAEATPSQSNSEKLFTRVKYV